MDAGAPLGYRFAEPPGLRFVALETGVIGLLGQGRSRGEENRGHHEGRKDMAEKQQEINHE
jgi:hypothetical protein